MSDLQFGPWPQEPPTDPDDPAEVVEGRFWLPEDRHRSYGRIEYNNAQGVRLHLVDANLGFEGADRSTPPAGIDVVHGETLGGSPMTLLGVHITNWTVLGAGPSTGNVIDGFAEQWLRGGHVLDANDIVLAGATCSLHGLKEFLTGGVIDGGALSPGDKPFASDTLVVPLADGAELMLVASRDPNVTRGTRRSDLVASAQWRFEQPVALPEAQRDYVRGLQDLILFATRRQSYVTGLNVWHPDDQSQTLRVVRQPNPRPRATDDVYALALNLRDLDDPVALVVSWFRLRRKIGPVWGVFFAGLDRPESLLEDRLLGLLAFAEGYHRAVHDQPQLTRKQTRDADRAIKAAIADEDVRRVYKQALAHAGDQTQRQRLQSLMARSLEPLDDWWYVDHDVLADRLIHTRNWLVHWGKPGSRRIEDPAGQVELLRALIIIIYMNLMLDLGLSVEEARRVIGSGWRLEGAPDDVLDELDSD